MPASCIYIREGRRRRGYYATLSARLAPSGNPESSPSRVRTRAEDEESDEENGRNGAAKEKGGRGLL